jgi:hypothetical protein
MWEPGNQLQKGPQNFRPDFGLILLVMIVLRLLFRTVENRRGFICPRWGDCAQIEAGLYRTKSLWERSLHSTFSLFLKIFFCLINW